MLIQSTGFGPTSQADPAANSARDTGTAGSAFPNAPLSAQQTQAILSAILGAPKNSQVGPSSGGGQYTVAKGDNLWDIAQSHGVSLQSLIAANPQIANPNLIYPGQQIHIPGGGGSQAGGNALPPAAGKATGSGGNAAPGTNSTPAGNDAAVAEQYLGDNASSLKQSGALPMDPNVPSTECCANFVSAVLEKSGLLPSGDHTDSVSTLNSELLARGWHQVDSAQAKAGDVAIVPGQHTEIVASNNNGKITLIGSNNVNSDGTQRVSYDSSNWMWQNGGIILAPPGS